GSRPDGAGTCTLRSRRRNVLVPVKWRRYGRAWSRMRVGLWSARDRSRRSKRSVERRRHGVIEPGAGKRPCREITRIEHRDIGCVGGRIVHEREHPTVVLGARTRGGHKDRLRDDPASVRPQTLAAALDLDLGNGIWKTIDQLPG